MPVTRELVFKDLSIPFNPHPVTGKITVLSNNDAVTQAVKNVVLTNHYERFYRPTFGGNITAMLFENIDNLTTRVVKRNIETAIANFEPRAEVIETLVDAYPDQNRLEVTLFFRVVNQREPVQAQIIVERTR